MGASWVPQVKYREDGAVDQFLSDISVLGPRGAELTRKSISVNDPLRFRVRQIPAAGVSLPVQLAQGGELPVRAIFVGASTRVKQAPCL